jgi:sugar phosphate isomerase/epimerase
MPRFGQATLNHSPLHGLPTQWELHLDAVAEAGFDALAPDIFWLRALEKEGVSLERLRQGLDARQHACMEVAGIAIGAEQETASELEEMLRYAEVLGAEFMNARLVEAPGPELGERLCRCADAFGKVGTRVALEFSRGTGTKGIADSRAFIEASGAVGVGVTLDTWHFFLEKESPDWDALEVLPASLLANVQLSDGVAYGDRSFGEATMNERRLPGEGDFDLERVARVLRHKGFDGAVILEVLSSRWRDESLDAFAREAAQTARDWWAGASDHSRPAV